jgi:tyrosine-specific transport protein
MARKGKLIDRQFLMATATLVGTAIGAGIFGLPYVVARAGFLPSLMMIFLLGLMMLISSLMYGEIILRTKGHCRLVSCAHKYMGDNGRRLAGAISFLSLYSGNLAYIILSGSFLNSFLSPILGGSEFLYSTLSFVFIFAATYCGSRIFSAIESWMTLLLVVLLAAVFCKGIFYVDPANLLTGDPSQLFLPFGVILFSLSANTAIPEIIRIVSRRPRRIETIITGGTILYTLIYVFFVAVIVGVTGADTSKESFTGLSRFIGDGVIVAGFLIGFLAVITSYLVCNIALKEILHYDYHLEERTSLLFASVVPYLLFLMGFRDFIQVVNFAGSVTGGLFGILIILIFYSAKAKGEKKPAYEIHVSREISFVMIMVYLLGIIYEITYNI